MSLCLYVYLYLSLFITLAAKLVMTSAPRPFLAPHTLRQRAGDPVHISQARDVIIQYNTI
jgi:hypothetical protein